MQVGDASSAWLTFCKGLSGEPAVSGNAGESQHLPYHERIPQLASRMGTLLAPAVVAPDAPEGRLQTSNFLMLLCRS